LAAWKIILVAIGLAADAFAVSVAEGILAQESRIRHMLRVSVMFGLFQGAMPVLGWLAGTGVRAAASGFDHWLAFALLALVGGKMLVDAITGGDSSGRRRESRGLRLGMLAVATSVDAFAVGLSIAMLGVSIWTPALVIAMVTATLSALGVQAGNRIGSRLGRRAELVGGLVLLGVGATILLEHLAG